MPAPLLSPAQLPTPEEGIARLLLVIGAAFAVLALAWIGWLALQAWRVRTMRRLAREHGLAFDAGAACLPAGLLKSFHTLDLIRPAPRNALYGRRLGRHVWVFQLYHRRPSRHGPVPALKNVLVATAAADRTAAPAPDAAPAFRIRPRSTYVPDAANVEGLMEQGPPADLHAAPLPAADPPAPGRPPGTGDPAFDRRYNVLGDHRAAAQWLSGPRRDVLLSAEGLEVEVIADWRLLALEDRAALGATVARLLRLAETL